MLLDLSIKSPNISKRSNIYLAQDTMDRPQVMKVATILGSKGVITCFILNNDNKIRLTNNFSLNNLIKLRV